MKIPWIIRHQISGEVSVKTYNYLGEEGEFVESPYKARRFTNYSAAVSRNLELFRQNRYILSVVTLGRAIKDEKASREYLNLSPLERTEVKL